MVASGILDPGFQGSSLVFESSVVGAAAWAEAVGTSGRGCRGNNLEGLAWCSEAVWDTSDRGCQDSTLVWWAAVARRW